jgi:hypothetical protein
MLIRIYGGDINMPIWTKKKAAEIAINISVNSIGIK